MPDDVVDLRARPVAVSLIGLAGAGAIVPFVVTVTTTKFDGTTFVYRDWVAIGGGIVAVVFAMISIAFARRAKDMALVLGALAIFALGGYQIARGLGVFAPKPELSRTVFDDAAPPPMAPQLPKAAPADPSKCADVTACTSLADAIKKSDAKGYGVASERACNFGDPYSCDHAGDTWADGRAGGKDLVRAHGLYEKGCVLKDRESCLDAGIDYMVGHGVDKDPAKSIPYFETACAADALVACKDLALAYRDGEGVKIDRAKSFAYAKHACGEGGYDIGEVSQVGYGCLLAGSFLSEGIVTKKDLVAAVAMFTKACDYYPQHCGDLAIAYDNGQGVAIDKKRAIELYGKACDADSGVACTNLAISYDQGDGVAADKKHATEIYKKACGLDSATSCNNLAVMTIKGEGGLTPDPAAAKVLYEKGCSLGSQNACKHLNKPPPKN